MWALIWFGGPEAHSATLKTRLKPSAAVETSAFLSVFLLTSLHLSILAETEFGPQIARSADFSE